MKESERETLVNYIWENYRDLIDRETGFQSLVRAVMATTSGTPDKELKFLQPEDEKYLNQEHESLVVQLKEMEVDRRDEIALSVLEIYKSIISLNYCQECGKLVKPPMSERCQRCGHTWYGQNQLKKMKKDL